MKAFPFVFSLCAGIIFPHFSQATEPDSAPKEFISLFNGNDLSGWVSEGTPSFVVKDKAIYATMSRPHPAWLRTEKEYENFVLRFSYKATQFYEGGILLHAPLEGPGSKIGFKLHLYHTPLAYGARSPGAIYDVAAPDSIAILPIKQWNRCEIVCDWPLLRVTMNGKVIHNINMNENEAFKHRLRRGYIGIQNIGGSHTSFKDIQIRPLPDQEQWTDLFEKGLDSLTFEGSSKWTFDPKTKTVTARGNNVTAHTQKNMPRRTNSRYGAKRW